MAEITRLLVATDDSELAESVRYGAPVDVDVEIASDAEAALARVDEWPPAVAIIDLRMGRAGGFALARDMQASARGSSVPIVLLLERDQDAWLAAQAGADVWCTKPFEISEILGEAIALARPAA